MRTLLPLGLLAAAALTSNDAAAYSIGSAKWSSGYITLNKVWWLPYYPDHDGAVEEAEGIVYTNASNAYLNLQTDDDYSVAMGNGESELHFTTDNSQLCGSDGCCWTWYNSGGTQIVEADVFMRWDRAWEYDHVKSDTIVYGGSERPLLTTLLHELGHAMGLGHEANIYNIMGEDFAYMTAVNSNSFQTALGEDATSGLRALYGTYSYFQDLSLTHWAFDFANGAYSWHRRTRLTSSSGGSLYTFASGSETGYYLLRGSTVWVEATAENNGAAGQSTAIKFYLSSDSNITTSDTLLTTVSTYFSPDSPLTTYYSVPVPSSGTTYTTMYIGAIIDGNGALSEINESNNASYIAPVMLY